MRNMLKIGFFAILIGGMILSGCAPEAFEMTADDCYDDETFVAEEQFCYLTCELEGTCAEDPGFLGFFGDFLVGLGDIVFGPPDDVNLLVTYDLENDRPVNPNEGEPLSDQEDEILADAEMHQEMWDQFANLIPAENRTEITRYGIFTDGVDNTMAYVEPNLDDPLKWTIVMDAVDAENKNEQQYTLIHEFGHVLTLNNSEVPYDEEANLDDLAYEEAAEACPRFFTGEGCANPNSYINAFFNAFWADIYEELPLDGDPDLIYEFYERYEDHFVTDYAATNPGEDIAESWTHFVLNDRPAGNTIADQKVAFFYDYPELVELRSNIRTRLYSERRRN